MSNNKKKQLAPTVVLASHGNKNACRDLYIHYYKNIFFICNSLTGNISAATKLTALAFIKMFASLDKLSDHNAFEQWFYSLTINLCRNDIPENSGDIIDSEIIANAHKAAECAKKHDMKSFERSVIKIIEKMLLCLPAKARILFFYNYFAQLNAEQTAGLEKTDKSDMEVQLNAVNLLIEKQSEKIKEHGVDISMFIKDMNETLLHIASKKFVPDSVHNSVSEELGIDVNPYSIKKTQKEEKTEEQTNSAENTTETKEKEKWHFTKGDLILFFSIIAVVLIIFSAASYYFNHKDEKDSVTTTIQADTEKPALLWNGAAASSFDGGSGTKDDPYQIATGGQLAYLANLVNDGNSYYAACHYILTADVILNKTDDFNRWDYAAPENEWTPIGSSSEDDSHSYFTGSFNGNDHTVSGMYVTGGHDYSGLFGVVRNAEIKNLTVKESYVNAGSYTGGIAGYFASDTIQQSGFSFCGFSGIVKSNGNNAGGITGYFRAEGDNNTATISYCFTSGIVTAENSYAGGITGASEADTGSAMIKNCFSSARIKAGNKNAGGITGDSRAADGIAAIENCYNAGIVTAEENAGGISGIINCVQGEGRVNIQNCFMLDSAATIGLTKGDGGEKLVVGSITILAENEMLNQDNFVSFNFDDIWTMPAEGEYKYPVLKGSVFVYTPITITEEGST